MSAHIKSPQNDKLKRSCRSTKSLNMIRFKLNKLPQTEMCGHSRLEVIDLTNEVWCMSLYKTVTPDVNNPWVPGWAEGASTRCEEPVPANSAHKSFCWEALFLPLRVTARSWSTPLLQNCWYLTQSSNCVLLHFGWAGLDWSLLLSMPPWLYFRTTAFFSSLHYDWDRAAFHHASHFVQSLIESTMWKNMLKLAFTDSTGWHRPRSIVVPLFALSELRGNDKDFCVVFIQISRNSI